MQADQGAEPMSRDRPIPYEAPAVLERAVIDARLLVGRLSFAGGC